MDLLHLESPTRASRVEIVPGLGGMTRQIELDFDGDQPNHFGAEKAKRCLSIHLQR